MRDWGLATFESGSVLVGTHQSGHHAAIGYGTLFERTLEKRKEAAPAGERLFIRVAAVMLAYYVGARIGFLLQTPLIPQSVLWLPNSILLAALIVSPPRTWPLFLVPSLAPQLLVGYQSNAPLPTITLLFLTNCADAILGAMLWRVVSNGELRIQSLRSMVLFLVFGAMIPTLVVSFADAAISVGAHWATDFWLAYTTRARSNVLTNVIFVPTALTILGCDRRELASWWRSRWVEGALVMVALFATSFVAAEAPLGTDSGRALSYLPLVSVVWCAVRFGIGMTGASILALTYITTWTFVRGMGPAVYSRFAVVPALQFGLLALAVPALCLAAVVQDRERASLALAESQRALRESFMKIQALAGELLWATERERSRIALELHDDVGQKMVALGLGLHALKRRMPNDGQLFGLVGSLQEQAVEVAEDVRQLSHDLHPAALRFGRLVPAMHELCARFESAGSMRASFTAYPEEFTVADDIALCIYRVTQEALSNAVRHSGAQAAYVILRASGTSLELHIEDNGIGFDTRAIRARGGMGLASMEERVRVVGGKVQIETQPGAGARISIRIPNRGAHVAADTAARG